MKKHLFLTIALILFHGCGSSNSSLLFRDPSFRPTDLLSGNIIVYHPLSIIIGNDKYKNYSKDEIKTDIANTIKERIESTSHQNNVSVHNKKIPGYIDGVLVDKKSAVEFIKSSKSKYIIFIQNVLIGKDSKTLKMKQPTGFYSFNQDITKVTMCFDVWNTEKGTMVLSVEASSDINDVLNTKGLSLACGKAIDQLIEYIRNN